MIDKEYIKEIISHITDVKTEKNVVPTNASMQEIMAAIREDVLECMRTMCNDRAVSIHISEPTRQAEISYAVFCLKKKKQTQKQQRLDK